MVVNTLAIPDTATNAGLMGIKDFSHLKSLNLSGTMVTDTGLIHLKSLSTLQYLDLYDTSVTPAGMTELRQVLPNIKIRH